MNRNLFFALACLATVLTGCAGKDFVRPAEGEIELGKSSEADVSKRMGEPYQKGEITKNDKQLKVARYAYASTGGEPAYPNVTPARAIAFTYYNGVVTSQDFVSSFKSDSTDFDESKISSIVKGKSTRQDVIALFGKPAGEAIYPMIKGQNDRAIMYSYSHVTGSVFNMKFYRKELIVSFDSSGLVSDVDYTSSGEKQHP